MLDVLKFVFSSFWIWFGTAIMLGVVVEGARTALVAILSALRGR